MKVIGSWKQRSGGRVREGESFSCKKIFVPTAVPKKVHAAVTFCTNGVETGKICPSLHTFPSKHRKIFEEMFKTNNKRARNLSKMAKRRGRTFQHQQTDVNIDQQLNIDLDEQFYIVLPTIYININLFDIFRCHWQKVDLVSETLACLSGQGRSRA